MKLDRKIQLLATALALALTPAVVAGTGRPAPGKSSEATQAVHPKQVRSHEAAGTIASLSASKLVLTRRLRGKNEEMAFVLDPETQREGDVVAGSHAIVKYRVENSQNIATLVKAHPIAVRKGKSQDR